MSYLSINNPPGANVANRQFDLPTPVPTPPGGNDASKLLGNKLNVLPEYNRATGVGRDNIVVSVDSLAKLFDMFELVFKAMRDLLSGKKPLPEPAPGDKTVTTGLDGKVQVDAGKQPEKKAQIDSKPVMPDTKVNSDVGKHPVVLPNITITPRVPGTDSKASSDTVVRVNVDLNVNNCHCPEDSHPAVPKVDTRVRPHPRPLPTIDPQARPDWVHRPTVSLTDRQVKPDRVPDLAVPETDAQVPPAVRPRPTPVMPSHDPKPEPDLTSPGPDCRPGERSWARGLSRRF
ncbi:hypothetical protein HBO02_12750 [Pseudomonas proteolytica]|uniref:hypothetical protein n=1 Tax=Pseudomonas proteolytica TaxID=219574 RepID=UPI001472F22B|nr:hypothetical protein [Pseudomonas proteolytica]NMZ23279.1 hypothetical protein [Pseudomonas proteolytica]